MEPPADCVNPYGEIAAIFQELSGVMQEAAAALKQATANLERFLSETEGGDEGEGGE